MFWFLWIAISVVIGVLASKRGREGIAWFFLALVVSPLIAGLLLVIVGPYKPALDAQQIASGAARKCPACAELVKFDAVKCKHCGTDLPPAEKPVERW